MLGWLLGSLEAIGILVLVVWIGCRKIRQDEHKPPPVNRDNNNWW